MMLLALDSSGPSESAAVFSGGALISEVFRNVGLTHSETLLPLADQAMKNAGVSAGEMDYFAVTCGPGSFTGLRIGIGTVKGMAYALQKPCVAVPTTEALVQNALVTDSVIVPVLDARRNRVWCAAFLMRPNGGFLRIMADGALPLPVLEEALLAFRLPSVFVGDAAEMCYTAFRDRLPLAKTALHHTFLRAGAVGAAALAAIGRGETVPPQRLVPMYLQPSQAEAERGQKMTSGGNHDCTGK